MKEYNQQIDDLINTGDVNNWRLALELCRGLIEDAQLFIGTKCLTYVQPFEITFTDELYNFVRKDCDCDWYGEVDTIKRYDQEEQDKIIKLFQTEVKVNKESNDELVQLIQTEDTNNYELAYQLAISIYTEEGVDAALNNLWNNSCDLPSSFFFFKGVKRKEKDDKFKY